MCVLLVSLGLIAKMPPVLAIVHPACTVDNVWRQMGEPCPASALLDIPETYVRLETFHTC